MVDADEVPWRPERGCDGYVTTNELGRQLLFK